MTTNLIDKLETVKNFLLKVKAVILPKDTSFVHSCRVERFGLWFVCTDCRFSQYVGKVKLPTPKWGNIYRKINGQWYEVCGTCLGNCGQCGTSVAQGVPASLDAIVKSGNWHLGLPVGMGYHRVAQSIDYLKKRIGKR